ncbi:MAG: hypothetical protein MUP16_09425 [Sedimentisphaerales bacterium]|nr:hypothetical protein [Sedimentisphaerales bacterium]
MGKIAAALTAFLAFLVASPFPAVAQTLAQDSGGYNNSYHFLVPFQYCLEIRPCGCYNLTQGVDDAKKDRFDPIANQ